MAKRKRQPYFSNNIRAITLTEPKYFPQVDFEDFMEYTVANWMLHSSHDCVIRTTHRKTGKVKEYSYKYRKCAMNKIEKLIGTHSFVVCDEDAIHQLSPDFHNDK